MRVAVIGGGIQGTSVALELSLRGVDVDLFDSRTLLMDGASRQSEGKIHLGFVYAKDRSYRTAELQMRGAGAFCGLMRRWLGPEFDEVTLSTSFNYVVHRKSLVSSHELADTYKRFGPRINRHCADGAYFGVENPGRVGRLSAQESQDLYGDVVDSVFTTEELAVETDSLADLITARVVDDPTITLHLGTKVAGVDSSDRRLVLSTDNRESRTLMTDSYEHIVNCAWEGRPAIDETVGLRQLAPWSHRMKYFIKTRSEFYLPSSTIVLGPFGDVVQFGDGLQYLSWYPSGLGGWSNALTPPGWPTMPSREEGSRIAEAILLGLSDVIPEVTQLAPRAIEVRGGTIFALGQTDIDDPASRLHERWEVGPVTLEGWYHSIDTGKYTTAPLFAMDVADRLTVDRS